LIASLYASDMPARRAARNVREFIRDLCATTSAVSLSNLISIGQILREAGEISQAGHGVNAATATSRDVATLLIAIAVEPKLKDAAQDVTKYSNLVEDEPEEVSGEVESKDPFLTKGYLLRHRLAKELEQCSSNGERRFSLFRVTLSDTRPTAYLRLARYRVDDSGDTFIEFIEFSFGPNELSGQPPEDKRKSIELDGRLLNTAADLLKPNVAAANRARLPASTNETGPPGDADGPVPLDETPRAARPEATTEHLEASDREKDSQVGFESQGESLGGAFVPPHKGDPDDDARNARAGPAQPCAP
jgi:hypothetical protein